MKTKKRILPALILSLAAIFAAPQAAAQQQRFTGVYVFGDSLSDAGFFRPFLAGLGLPAAVVAQLGSFTTNPGDVWSELVSQHYGFAPSPSNANGGNIFAQGGARVATDSASTPPGFAQRPVSTQIGEFLARTGGVADPNALYFVWAGGNDFLQNIAQFQAGQITQAQLQAGVLGAATAEIGQIARLRGAGARYIAVFGLPNIGLAPASLAGGAAAVGAATQLSAGFNTTLFTGLASQGIRVIPVDVFSLINQIAQSPGTFGFSNITGIACGPFPPITTSGNSQFCLPSNLVASGADTSFLFADAVHPTSGTHRIIANFVTSLIDGPTQHSLLAEAALRTRASHVRAIGDGITTGRQADVGSWSVFAGVDGSDFDVNAGQGFTGMDSRSRAGTLGVTARASESVVLGAAFGYAKNSGSFGRNAGGFEANEHTWSLFGSMKWGGFYGSAVLSLADLDFNDIHRNIQLGPAFFRATGNAEGSNSSAQVILGYDFPVRRLTIGPTVMVTTQNVTVNGFVEGGAGAANLRIHEQKRRSEIWSVGVRASYDLGGWTPWLRVTADKERRDDERFVSATPLTMDAIGSIYDIPALQSDTKFLTVALGLNGWITPRVGLSLAGFRVEGRDGIDEHGASAMVSLRF